jgi:hypothetical protein
MSKLVFLVFSISFLIGAASAQMRSGNAFFGYSYYNNTNLSSPLFNRATTNGWEASVEGKILPFMGVVADLDGHVGSQNVSTCGQGCGQFRSAVSQYNYLFGPRVSVSVAKFRPFAEVLIGGGHVNVHLLSRYFIRNGCGWWLRLQSHAFARLATTGRLCLHAFLQRKAKQHTCLHRHCRSLLVSISQSWNQLTPGCKPKCRNISITLIFRPVSNASDVKCEEVEA